MTRGHKRALVLTLLAFTPLWLIATPPFFIGERERDLAGYSAWSPNPTKNRDVYDRIDYARSYTCTHLVTGVHGMVVSCLRAARVKAFLAFRRVDSTEFRWRANQELGEQRAAEARRHESEQRLACLRAKQHEEDLVRAGVLSFEGWIRRENLRKIGVLKSSCY